MLYLVILIPVLAALPIFFIKDSVAAKRWSFLASICVLAVATWQMSETGTLSYEAEWLPALGAKFSLATDGMAKMLVLLTALSLPLILAGIWQNKYASSNAFYALLLLAQAGLFGVFLAADVLLFYFFWELALIPVYFLASIWGGTKRVQAAFKFFIYTFIGSLLLLVGIIYLYLKMPEPSFAIQSYYQLSLSLKEQQGVFWLFFIAFAIKMPIFPLHTWQPLAYQQAPTAVTAVLSGVMVKMGIYAVIRFVLPIFPLVVTANATLIMWVAIVGIVYASLLAIKQDDMKKLVAYSSIAHIGLMGSALFSKEALGTQGVLIQMFNHGINVIGLWIAVNAIEKICHTTKISELGGLAQKAPMLTILFVLLAFANVSLPLTNAFVGEFLMFNALFRYNIWMAVVACISVVLVAVYTLNLVQNVFYGKTTEKTEHANDIPTFTIVALWIIALLIVVLGVYPQPLFDLVK